MTNQSPESVIAEVIEYHADTIGSHWDGCYKHHAVCLAVKLQDMLRGSGVPDTQRRAVRELIAEARGFWGSETREYAEGLVSRLADALEAQQVDENVMDEEASYDWCCATCGGKERVRGAFMSVGQNHNCLETDETRQVDEAKLAEVAERDAANAAIARVRALETFSITDSYPAWTAVDHDDLLAALDGAPEPEWEYGVSVDGLDGEPEPRFTRDSVQHMIDHPDLYRKWTHGNPVIMHRRIPSGPWLPVEGEGKP